MSDKYKQAVANAMKGKCIPYKKETKAVLNKCLIWLRLNADIGEL